MLYLLRLSISFVFSLTIYSMCQMNANCVLSKTLTWTRWLISRKGKVKYLLTFFPYFVHLKLNPQRHYIPSRKRVKIQILDKNCHQLCNISDNVRCGRCFRCTDTFRRHCAMSALTQIRLSDQVISRIRSTNHGIAHRILKRTTFSGLKKKGKKKTFA